MKNSDVKEKGKKKGYLIVFLLLLAFFLLTNGYMLAKQKGWFGLQSPEPSAVVSTATPTKEVTAEPTVILQVTEEPSIEPTEEPTKEPSEEPSSGYVTYPETVNPYEVKPDTHPKAPDLPYVANLVLPKYEGEPYVMLNDGQPFFETDSLVAQSYEIYYDLDEFGRCTLADAVAGQDLMPTKKRGSISSVKPTGWHSDQYEQELVDGRNLYNRCHLIAFGLCGEEANPYNLVTGTRYFNTKGINDFENMVIDYIRETGNHVRYRVTPIFEGDNLVCSGQIVEAYSIEDEGEAICFNVYSFNVQPGVYIDYLTGDNHLDGAEQVVEEPVDNEPSEEELPLIENDFEGDFVMNAKTKKFHRADCEGAAGMSEKNRREYHGYYNDLIREGYEPDKGCLGGPK